jgi:hypothetical protein
MLGKRTLYLMRHVQLNLARGELLLQRARALAAVAGLLRPAREHGFACVKLNLGLLMRVLFRVQCLLSLLVSLLLALERLH